MDRLAIYHVDLEFAGRQHLKKLTQGLLPGDGVAVPHQGGCAHVQAGQQPPPLEAEFSNYDGKFRLPLVLTVGRPIFHSNCEGEMEVALESL